MKRRLLNLLTVLSLVLCVAVVGLWVRSYLEQDLLQVQPRAGGAVVHVFWAKGSIACTGTIDDEHLPPRRRFRFRRGRPDGGRPLDLYEYWQSRDPLLHVGGISVVRPVPEYGALGGVLVPLWLPAILFALLPFARFRSHGDRSRRRRLGLCPECGYDLRATPGRCPECGGRGQGA